MTRAPGLLSRGGAHSLATWITASAFGSCIGLLAGGAAALFLTLLAVATQVREADASLVFGLPLAGLGLGWWYERYGQKVIAGNNLVIETIVEGGPQIPLRMAPMVLLATVVTHLFGGSAGREGTAVQIGASLADAVFHRWRLTPELRRHVLVAGVAGGFGAVFGTPLAGIVFGIEFAIVGSLGLGSLAPALCAALVGDWTVRALGVGHMMYPQVAPLDFSLAVCVRWTVFAVAVAGSVALFIALTHSIKRHSQRWVPRLPVRMCLGGLIIVLMWKAVGNDDYLGLGLPTMGRAFLDPALPWYTFLGKLVFTAVTLGTGFLGGEVTPLFFVGATLGNALAAPLGLPLEMCAGVGLAATFAVASNTPFALTVMAVELFGIHVLPHVAFVSVLAYLMTGPRSIYSAQRGLDAKLRW
jgi:H+/Cl- antiporter ClcA